MYLTGSVFGALAMAISVMHVMANYENGLFHQLHAAIVQPGETQMERVVAITNAAHNLVKPRKDIFSDRATVNLRDEWFSSGDVFLNDGRGACGSYTNVVANLLDEEGIDFRPLQLYCSDTGQWGCHITLEAKVDGQWHVIDGLNNVIFPVGAAELKRNWSKYKGMVPLDYHEDYDYNDYRYTNWNKIPIVMPAVKAMLDWTVPDFAATLSIRKYVLNTYRAYEVELMGLTGLFAVFAAAIRARR